MIAKIRELFVTASDYAKDVNMVMNTNLRWQILKFDELNTCQLYSILELRQEIFVVEQACAYLDLDRLDQTASHIMCIHKNSTIAYARALPPARDSGESSLSRIVVSREMRGTGIGRELVSRAIESNLKIWPMCQIRISAQTYLINFYNALGFTVSGLEYLEDGIPHIKMVL